MKKAIFLVILAAVLIAVCVACAPNAEEEGKNATTSQSTVSAPLAEGTTTGNGSTVTTGTSTDPSAETTDTATTNDPVVELPKVPF